MVPHPWFGLEGFALVGAAVVFFGVLFALWLFIRPKSKR